MKKTKNKPEENQLTFDNLFESYNTTDNESEQEEVKLTNKDDFQKCNVEDFKIGDTIRLYTKEKNYFCKDKIISIEPYVLMGKTTTRLVCKGFDVFLPDDLDVISKD